MELAELLLKEIKEGYYISKACKPYSHKRGKGTKSYLIDRIKLLRAELLEMQKEIEKIGRKDL